VAARRRPANPDRLSVRANHPDHRHGSRVGPDRSGDGIGAQIHREAMGRRPRRPVRSPIRIGAAGAAVAVGAAVRGLAVRVRAGVQAVARGPVDVATRAEFAGIEWTSVALA